MLICIVYPLLGGLYHTEIFCLMERKSERPRGTTYLKNKKKAFGDL